MSKNPIPVMDEEGRLTEALVIALESVCSVEKAQLQNAQILPSTKNMLHMPWFNAGKGGGAMVIGQRIYFTSNWFKASDSKTCYGDGSLRSTKNWMLMLAHEVRHLNHARNMGYYWPEKLAYVTWFGICYAWYSVTGKRPFTDHMPLEIDADLGRKTLVSMLFDHGEPYENHPLVRAVHEGNTHAVEEWLATNSSYVNGIKRTVAESISF